MRPLARVLTGAAACAPLMLALPSTAAAAEPGDVTYSYAVNGSSVTNTITNNSGVQLQCGTSLAPAPGGVLPPVAEVLANGQTLYSTDPAGQPGVSTQTVSDVPAGDYVVLATCGTQDSDPAYAWISDYPGIQDQLGTFPWTVFTVQQASTVVTVGPPSLIPDLGSLLPSGSAF
ncbi:hypothetical protein HQ346_24610 [Rhodococcus sp. BP-252]|uniref:Ig-like domain-containing protein n=1 Tax=Rhodococcoides kyotonense TaxID=398843 RepID=A0A177YKJ0_9NOCA|nr:MULTISPECIES: hypothetical protein [Rhodococcus]MBY6414786.1 hypothetical protein [Rhodococcus sp. BP-320]MBY6419690.1 hypothetical protein [Rhodococcus sp. BP-321]MBY6424667.1 hypothetical protein [Rhodococcus sp. BP-324]MBY6429664.1 hypothetical protein [Rhodococcus sp. BP-323]MBY6434614.1 hypothetical protein [Rhodococcus sp. BP-322]